jgi:hypothetical protein
MKMHGTNVKIIVRSCCDWQLGNLKLGIWAVNIKVKELDKMGFGTHLPKC